MNRAQAKKHLGYMTDLRTYKVGNEEIAPAEDVLLKTIMFESRRAKIEEEEFGIAVRSRRTRLHNLKLIAKTLDLWPIPNWWIVKQRLLGADSE